MLPFQIWDVFTDTAFTGNPLAVVMCDGDLDGGRMQVIARQFNLSETIFLMPPEGAVHTRRVRIFFPDAEVSFAGHPIIGAAHALAARGAADRMVFETGAGAVAVSLAEGLAQLTLPVLPACDGHALARAGCAAALGLAEEDLGDHTPRVWSGGPRFLFVQLRDRAALARARPVQPAWDALMGPRDLRSIWCYDPDLNARKFTATAEDPATGSAVGLLAGQLLSEGDLAEGWTRYAVRQGDDMGRPSRIEAEVQVAQGRLATVRIAGRAVPTADGRIRIPG